MRGEGKGKYYRNSGEGSRRGERKGEILRGFSVRVKEVKERRGESLRG